MSFAEFSYPLLQAWDWWELFKRGVQVQVGGADQFGNILAGAEAVKIAKKVDQVHFENDGTFQGHVGSSLTPVPKQSPNYGPNINEPMGFTVPLLTTSAGEKFGKSAGNAIWLDKSLTSATELYQFFIRTADADVERYLKLFTFLSIPEIRGIMEDHRLDESKGLAQKKLASEFVELIHGESAAQEAETQHMKLFGPNVSIDDLREESSSSAARSRVPGDWNSSLNPYAKATSSENAPSIRMKLPRSLVVGRPFTGVLWSAGLVSSKGEAQRLISSKGCHIGARIGRDKDPTEMGDSLAFLPITSTHPDDTEQFLIDGHLLVIRIGKWKMKIINVVSDEEYDASGLTCPGWKEPADSGKEDYKKRQQEISAFIASKRQKQAQIQKMPKAERQTRDYQMDEEE